jgi:hypothetical protein
MSSFKFVSFEIIIKIIILIIVLNMVVIFMKTSHFDSKAKEYLKNNLNKDLKNGFKKMTSPHKNHSQVEIKKIVSFVDVENENPFSKLIQREKYPINCKLLYQWDKKEVDKSEKLLESLRSKSDGPILGGLKTISLLKTENFIFNESMCDSYRQIRQYDSHIVDESELKMPIAYSILTYDNLEQFERLLRIIYRPHNVYCIHVDAKSGPQYIKAIQSITKCFSNVFIATKLERVIYAHFSRVQADINCMSDLIEPNS